MNKQHTNLQICLNGNPNTCSAVILPNDFKITKNTIAFTMESLDQDYLDFDQYFDVLLFTCDPKGVSGLSTDELSEKCTERKLGTYKLSNFTYKDCVDHIECEFCYNLQSL